MVDYLLTWTEVMLSPASFYRRMRTNGGFGEPLTFAAINLIIGCLLITIFSFFFNTMFGSFSLKNIFTDNSNDLIDLIITTVIVTPIQVIVYILIWGLIQLVFFKLFGGKGNYEGTVRVLSYATSVYILAWIPVIGLILMLYYIYLNIVGGSKVHKISLGSSAIAVLLPSVLLFIAVFLSALALVSLMI